MATAFSAASGNSKASRLRGIVRARHLIFTLMIRHPGAALLALALALGDPAAGAAQDTPGAEVALRVVTYNIAAARIASLDEIGEVLAGLDADVIALQEVASNWEEVSRNVEQAAELARRLEMEAFYAPIHSIDDDDGERCFGLAILTAHPILSRTNHRLTRLSSLEKDPVPRPMPGFPQVVIQAGELEIAVLNTHLDYRGDPAIRIRQVEEMISIVGAKGGPILLIGDLNARPDAPEIQPLLERFTDSWAGRDDPGYTFPAESPDRRIDYILFTEECFVESVFVHDAVTSDHLPVVADLVCGD